VVRPWLKFWLNIEEFATRPDFPKISEKKYCNGPKGTTREQAVGHLVNPVQYQQESVRRIRLGGVAKGRIVLLLRTNVPVSPLNSALPAGQRSAPGI
jgi:hypothetical protein